MPDSIKPKQLLALLKKGIHGALFPPRIWAQYQTRHKEIFQKPLHEITSLREAHKNSVNDLIEEILASPSEQNTFRLLASLDPTRAVFYRDRLDSAVGFLSEGIEPDAEIHIPPNWSDLLRILLLRHG